MSVNPNQTNANATTSFFLPAAGGGGAGSNFPQGLVAGVQNSGGAVYGVSSMTANLFTTASNYSWIPQRYSLNPASAAQGGLIGSLFTFDPQDAGQTAVFFGAKSNGAGFVSAIWEGYISMPLEIAGATVQIASDNETFLYMDGNAGALGSISTGTPFISGSNAFSSIVAPGGQQANMTALFSTLQSLYPSNFS